MDPRIDVLLVLLEQYRDELSKALESVSYGLREVRPAGGAWSAANVIEHLASTERAVTGFIAGFLASAELRSDEDAFDRTRFERDIDMPFFLDRSRRIQGSQPTGSLSGGEAWEALNASRRDLRAVLDQSRGRRLEDFTRPHPATHKPMNGYQWLAFIGLHEGRHAAQLKAIASSLISTHSGRDA